MPTTIQIDKVTKRKLFQIKLKLEEEKGSPITYNEVINYLIKNQATNLFRKKNLKNFRKMKGILPKNALKEFHKYRREELIREEKKAPLPKSKYSKELAKEIFKKENKEEE
jgi:hypothetical protein